MWQVDPGAELRQRRAVGALVLLAVAVVVALGLWRQFAAERPTLQSGFAALAAALDGPRPQREAALADAAAAFRHAAGVMGLEPLAVTGLALVAAMHEVATASVPTARPGVVSPEEATRHALALAATGQVDAALRWLDGQIRAAGPRPTLRQMQVFLERLREARHRRDQPDEADAGGRGRTVSDLSYSAASAGAAGAGRL